MSGVDTQYGIGNQNKLLIHLIGHFLRYKKLFRFSIEHYLDSVNCYDIYLETKDKDDTKIYKRLIEVKCGENISSKEEVWNILLNNYRAFHEYSDEDYLYEVYFSREIKNYLSLILFLQTKINIDPYKTFRNNLFKEFAIKFFEFCEGKGLSASNCKNTNANRTKLQQIIRKTKFVPFDDEITFSDFRHQYLVSILKGYTNNNPQQNYDHLFTKISDFIAIKKNTKDINLFFDTYLFNNCSDFMITESKREPFIAEWGLCKDIYKPVKMNFNSE